MLRGTRHFRSRSKAALSAPKPDFRVTLNNGHRQTARLVRFVPNSRRSGGIAPAFIIAGTTQTVRSAN